MANAIEIRGIGKRYRLGVDATGYDTLQDAVLRTLRRQGGGQETWALRDVDLDVERGEALGIIGDNGAGKTTLLKILAGITEPTSGEARVRGRVGALLDVGTGFNVELTGRENVYLSGAILGLRRAEVRELFDEILDFAGIDQFIDTPVKRYSAGMQLRLAFAVAAFIRPAILVVDEILAVGDAAFREKCLGRMAEITEEARTVLFVTHDLGAITKLCTRSIWLEGGTVRRDGLPADIVSAYLSSGMTQSLTAEFDATDSEVTVVHASIRAPGGDVLTSVRRDQPFTVRLGILARDQLPAFDVAIMLTNDSGVRIIEDSHSDYEGLPHLGGRPARYEIDVLIPPVLAPGRHSVSVWVGTHQEDFVMRDLLTMSVSPRPDDSRVSITRRRAAQPHLSWSVRQEPLV